MLGFDLLGVKLFAFYRLLVQFWSSLVPLTHSMVSAIRHELLTALLVVKYVSHLPVFLLSELVVLIIPLFIDQQLLNVVVVGIQK